jgi:hypothetical protein
MGSGAMGTQLMLVVGAFDPLELLPLEEEETVLPLLEPLPFEETLDPPLDEPFPELETLLPLLLLPLDLELEEIPLSSFSALEEELIIIPAGQEELICTTSTHCRYTIIVQMKE